MESASTNPPIVLIHGLWMTPRSWEHWNERYERRGYEVLTPAYPGPGGRGRGAARGPLADREPDRARDPRRTSRRSSAGSTGRRS